MFRSSKENPLGLWLSRIGKSDHAKAREALAEISTHPQLDSVDLQALSKPIWNFVPPAVKQIVLDNGEIIDRPDSEPTNEQTAKPWDLEDVKVRLKTGQKHR